MDLPYSPLAGNSAVPDVPILEKSSLRLDTSGQFVRLRCFAGLFLLGMLTIIGLVSAFEPHDRGLVHFHVMLDARDISLDDDGGDFDAAELDSTNVSRANASEVSITWTGDTYPDPKVDPESCNPSGIVCSACNDTAGSPCLLCDPDSVLSASTRCNVLQQLALARHNSTFVFGVAIAANVQDHGWQFWRSKADFVDHFAQDVLHNWDLGDTGALLAISLNPNEAALATKADGDAHTLLDGVVDVSRHISANLSVSALVEDDVGSVTDTMLHPGMWMRARWDMRLAWHCLIVLAILVLARKCYYNGTLV